MKHYLLTVFLLLCIFGMSKGEAMRFATFNIRRIGWEAQEKNKWEKRKDVVFSMIKNIQPDIIGFQEVSTQQRSDLTENLSNYNSFGDARNMFANFSQSLVLNSSKLVGMFLEKYKIQDEQSPIFYDRDKFNVKEYGTFSLNAVYSLVPRICTWGFFEEKATGNYFYVYNTHLDHMSSAIRSKQIDIIFEDIKRRTKNFPVILMGDFNAIIYGKGPDAQILQKIADESFVDAKKIAQVVEGPEKTQTGWNNEKLKAIDHIFIRNNAVQVLRHVVVDNKIDDTMVSDHRLVLADIVLFP